MILNIAVSFTRAAVESNGGVKVLLPRLNGELITCEHEVPNAAEVIVLVRAPNSSPGWYRVAAQINANGDEVPTFTRPIRIVEQMDDPLLAEDETTREILSRLSRGYDLLDDQREIVEKGQLTIKDSRNIKSLITYGMGEEAKCVNDFRIIGQYCKSLVHEENWAILCDFVNSISPGLHCFADGLRENKKLKELAKGLEQAA